MSNPPTFRQLQYLAAVAEYGQFHAAAAACHVSQPTLSVGIMEMEKLLGLPVLDRSNRRRVVLTPFGEEVLSLGRDILQKTEKILARARSLTRPFSGPFRLGVIPTVAPYLLPVILGPLQKKFPDLEFEITEDLSAAIVDKVKDGTLDMALMAFPYDIDGMTHRVLCEEPFYAAMPRDLFPGRKALKTEDLKGHRLLLLEDGHCLRDHALSACGLQPPQERKTFSAASLATLIQLVRQGQGITLLPEMAVKEGYLPKDLKVLPFSGPVPTRQIGLAWRAGAPAEPEILGVCEALTAFLKRSQ